MSATNNSHPYDIRAPVLVTNTTTSTNTTTGSTVITGGLGVGGSSFVSAITAGGLVTAGAGLTSTLGTTNLGSTTFAASSTINVGSNVLTSMGSPLIGTDAATKSYTDAVYNGINTKFSVIATTTANGTLSTAYENGQVIDGVTLATGNRILLKDQTTATENGIYVVNASGAPTRATDFAVSATVGGAYVFIQQGTLYSDTGFLCTNNTGADIVGTNNLAFVQFSSAGVITAGTGLTKTGNNLTVNALQTQITQLGTLTGLAVDYTGTTHTYNFLILGSIATDAEIGIVLGQNASTYNSGVIDFNYDGGSGSSQNFLGLGVYGFSNMLKIRQGETLVNGTITCGNQAFRVYVMTGTHGVVTSTSTPALPSGVTKSNIMSIKGYTVSGTSVVSFDWDSDANWGVDMYVTTSDTVSLYVSGGAAASNPYRITILTTS